MEAPNFADPAGHTWERIWLVPAMHRVRSGRQREPPNVAPDFVCPAGHRALSLPHTGQRPGNVAAKMTQLLARGRLAQGCHACDSRSPVQPTHM